MIVYLYDSELNEVSHRDILHPNLLYRVSVRNHTPLADAVAAIVREFSRRHRSVRGQIFHPTPQNTISKLVVVAHGGRGRVNIGEGLHFENASVLAPLAPFFASPNDGVIFTGCFIMANRTVHRSTSIEESFDRMLEATELPGHRYDSLHIQRVTDICFPMGSDYQLEQQYGMALIRQVQQTLHTSVEAAIGLQFSDTHTRLRLGRRGEQDPLIDTTDFEGRYVRLSAQGQAVILQGTPYRDVIRTHLPAVESRPQNEVPNIDLSDIDNDEVPMGNRR